MKKSTKAALISGLICPGIGQFWLKCYVRGIFFIVATSAALIVLIKQIVDKVTSIIERLPAHQMDVQAINDLVHQSPSDSINTTGIVILILWILSNIDAYIAGNKQDSTLQ